MQKNENTSRAALTLKNVSWGYINTLLTGIITFITRTMIVLIMGERFNGVNGLFSSVLGVLSFAELGFGVALNYSLYKPAAEGDKEKLKSLMQLYKKTYRIIAAVIAAAGLCLLPFLDVLVKDPGDVGNIRIYYLFFLFNTVTSYFVSYKYSLVNAMQENFRFSRINMVTKISVSLLQIAALALGRSYLIYLAVGAVAELAYKAAVSVYLDRKYPLLAEKNVQPLDAQERKAISTNVRAMVWHKVGDVCVYQTDNILISAFVGVAVTGRVTYYNTFTNAALQVMNAALSAVVGNMGNAMADSTSQRRHELFCAYRMVAFWISGFLSIGMFFMASRLVAMTVGESMVLPQLVLFLILLDFYMGGHRIALNNFKAAGGVFRQDQYVALLQAGVNLVSSILFVRLFGLPGVYMGTVLQGTLSTVIRPFIVYRAMFGTGAGEYFVSSARYLAVMAAASAVCWAADTWLFAGNTLLCFVLELLFITVAVNGIFLLCLCRTREFRYLWNKLASKIFARFIKRKK